MKSKAQVLIAFLAIATIETLALFVRAGIAIAEPILSQQEFGSYLTSLPIELSQEQISENERRLRDFFLASDAEPSTRRSEFGKPEFGSHIAALPIESIQVQLSADDRLLRNFLVASLTPSEAAYLIASEQDFSGELTSLPVELTPTLPSEAYLYQDELVNQQPLVKLQDLRENLVALLSETEAAPLSDSNEQFQNYLAALPTELQPAQPTTDQNFRSQLVALLTQPATKPLTTEQQNFRVQLVALLTKQPKNPISPSEQDFRSQLVALLTQPKETKLSLQAQNLRDNLVALLSRYREEQPAQADRNIDVPAAPDENKTAKVERSPSEQSYSDYLVALRSEVDTAPSQSQASQGQPKTKIAPISKELKILSPKPDAILDIPAAAVTVQYPLGSQIELLRNNTLIDPKLIGGTETNNAAGVVTQTWYGVSLNQGENTIAARIKGNGAKTTFIRVFVRGTAKEIKLQTVEARIPADGRTTATIQGELLDDKGNRSSQDALVTLFSSAGEFVGADAKPDDEGFQVIARQGRFTAKLRSGLKAQTVRIAAKTVNLEGFTSLQFETDLRSSIVTGVVDFRIGSSGTNFYKSFRDFLPPDRDGGTQIDLHTHVFATGKIGEWLFTGAYNSDRNLNQNCDGTTSLSGEYQFCDRNYPVYGDSSQTERLAPSRDSLYLRFERSAQIPSADPDYVMWGDYDTKEFARSSQQFTATSRQLHGFKANYNIGDVQVTGFYGDNVEGFQRDAIAPDGTSGYYFLSRRLLIQGSENVSIETEELNRPGTVLDRQQLNRGADYEIDYDRGTLLFRQPILRTGVDDNGLVLVRRIIVTYQYESQGKNSNIYGGRIQYNISRELNHESWLGATYIKETQGVRDFELYGADAQISIGKNSHLILEYAHSNNNSEMMSGVGGSAYRIEAEGEIAQGVQGRAYYRSTDTGFSNNATISFVPGQTRYGAQVTGKVSPTTDLRFQYDHENNNGIAPQPLNNFTDLFTPRTQAIPGSRVDNSLTTITAGVQQKIGNADLTVDWIHRRRKDRIQPEALSGNSDQLRSRLTVPITDTLDIIAQNELTISQDTDAVYPDRTILGLDWKVAPDLSIRLAQQFYTRGEYEGNSITSLEVAGERKLGEDTTLTGRYGILNGINGMTTQGAIGLKHGWTISPGLKLSLAYERVFGEYYGRTGAGTQFAQPYAPGQSASSLGFGSGDSYSAGLEYTDNPDLKASVRYEHRSSSSGSNNVISAGVTGKISPALTALLNYQQANASNQKLNRLGDTVNLKLGLAYRDPNDDRLNALLRYEYRKNPSTIPDTILLGSGTGSEDHTFALETIYAPNWQWEFYGKYAIRNSTSYLANDLVGSSTVNLAQLRTTYRLGYNWDVVGEARWINQPSENHSETGLVLEAGYYLTPNLRLSAGYTFGNIDDRDFSGSRSADGAYFGLTVKLNELFDGFGLQKPVPAQQRESKVKPIAKKPLSQPLDTAKELPNLSESQLQQVLDRSKSQPAETNTPLPDWQTRNTDSVDTPKQQIDASQPQPEQPSQNTNSLDSLKSEAPQPEVTDTPQTANPAETSISEQLSQAKAKLQQILDNRKLQQRATPERSRLLNNLDSQQQPNETSSQIELETQQPAAPQMPETQVPKAVGMEERKILGDELPNLQPVPVSSGGEQQ